MDWDIILLLDLMLNFQQNGNPGYDIGGKEAIVNPDFDYLIGKYIIYSNLLCRYFIIFKFLETIRQAIMKSFGVLL